MERGVSGCPGSARFKGESQLCALRCLCVSSIYVLPRLHVSDSFIDSRLADRTAKLATPLEFSAGPGQLRSSGHEAHTAPPPPATSKKQPTERPSGTDLLNITRAELSAAQRSRSELQDRLDRVNTEYERLRKKSAHEDRRLNSLDHEKTNLQLRLKDRDEELRRKAKLLEVGKYYVAQALPNRVLYLLGWEL